jgi:hypothetical protein
MPYLVPDFDHDVFMSYAHGQLDGYPDAPLRDWSQKFIDHLRAETYALRPDIGEVTFCDDRSVDPTAALTDDIKVKVERSGVLLIIMSPAYLLSKWCTDELDWFKAQFMGRRRSPGRVFVVRAVSTKTDGWPRWPDFLKDSSGHPDIGFRFHQETREVGIEPYGWPDLRFRSEEFNKEFRTLRTTLIKRLEALRADMQPTPSPLSSRQGATGPPRLYLHTPPGPEDVRTEVESELRAEGYTIVSVTPRTNGSLDWRDERKDRLEVVRTCDVLTLLRPTDDPAFDLDFSAVGIDTLNHSRRPTAPVCNP